MTHDPLCPLEPNPLARECRTCDLITKVRADTLSMMRETVQLAAQEAAFTRSMDGLFDAVDLIDSAIRDLGGSPARPEPPMGSLVLKHVWE